MLLGSLIGLTSCASENNYNSNSSTSYNQQENGKTNQQDKKDVISIERIEELMKRGSVDEILKEEYENKTIEYLVYNHPKNPEEVAKAYKRFVFQENLKPEERKPVLVLFYSGDNDLEHHGVDATFRLSIIFKEIEKIYGDKINSLAFKVPYTDINAAAPYGKPLEKLIGIWVGGSTTLALYGQYDLLKEETPEKNDGKIKHLDTSDIGPREDKDVNPLMRNSKNYWIGPNIFNEPNPDNNGKLHRYNGRLTLQVVKER